jgi:hypothetical protein
VAYEVARVLDGSGRVALWARQADGGETVREGEHGIFLGYEQLPPDKERAKAGDALCWADRPIMGGNFIYSPVVRAALDHKHDDDVQLPCELITAGRMRMGAPRWWCRTHQTHWGMKSDIARAVAEGTLRCANHKRLMSYAQHLRPVLISAYSEIVVSCVLPPALTTVGESRPSRPRIRVSLRGAGDNENMTACDEDALLVSYTRGDDLFAEEPETIAITPPAAFEFVRAVEHGRTLSCVECRDCGYPHLDVGPFHERPHAKHLCSNCGRDNTWSDGPIASTPLIHLRRLSFHAGTCVDAQAVLNLDEYPDAEFSIWASLPAILWRARMPEVRGIRVKAQLTPDLYIDDVFGTVIYRGRHLERALLLDTMAATTVV